MKGFGFGVLGLGYREQCFPTSGYQV